MVGTAADGLHVEQGGTGGVDDNTGAVAVGPAAVAELAVGVVAPTEQAPVVGQCQAVLPAGGEPCNVADGHEAFVHHRQRVAVAAVGAIAELAVAVVAERPHAAVGEAHQCEITAGANLGNSLERAMVEPERGHRAQPVAAGVVTERAVAVVAPAEQPAVGLQREAVAAAGFDGNDAGDGQAVGIGQLRRVQPVGVVAALAAAELAGVIGAPGPDGAVGLEREAVVVARGNGDDAAERRAALIEHGPGQGAGVGGAVAELTLVVVAEGPDLAGTVEGEAVVLARGHRDDVAQAQHRLRIGLLCGITTRTVAELAVIVVAPREHAAVHANGEAVVATGGNDLRCEGRGQRRIGLVLELVTIQHTVTVAVAARIGRGQVAEGVTLPTIRQAVAVAVDAVARIQREGVAGVPYPVAVGVAGAGRAEQRDRDQIPVRHIHGAGLIPEGPVAELSGAAVAPRPERAVVEQCEAERLAAEDLPRARDLPDGHAKAREALDPNAELSLVIAAPGNDLPVRAHREAVAPAGTDVLNTG